MATMRIVPNEGQPTELEQMYAGIADVPFNNGGQGPARLPGSPPFQMPPRNWSGPGPSYSSGPVGPAVPPKSVTTGPVYPGTWKGHAWRVGPGVNYTGGQSHGSPSMYGGYGFPIPGIEGGSQALTSSPDFMKFVKFGIVDNGLLIIMTAAGAGLDKWISEFLRVPEGWGPIIGASVGNALSDGVAGFADGAIPAVSVTFGALIPVIPVGIAAYLMKKTPSDKNAQRLLMGASAAMVLWAFMSGKNGAAQPAQAQPVIA